MKQQMKTGTLRVPASQSHTAICDLSNLAFPLSGAKWYRMLLSLCVITGSPRRKSCTLSRLMTSHLTISSISTDGTASPALSDGPMFLAFQRAPYHFILQIVSCFISTVFFSH